MKTIGQKIADTRFKKRWTQEQLAAELNIKQSLLSDIENDKVSPKWELIVLAAEKMDVSVADLLPENVSNVLIQPNMNDNSVGFINQYGTTSDRREILDTLLEMVIQNQKLILEMVQAQNKKI